jgi:CO dehydrogenase maturation factor
MPRVIATLGKGGVGKTIVSALAIKSFAETGARVLAIDADPAGGLGLALGLEAERTVNDIRLEIIEAIKDGESNKPDLVMSLDYHLLNALCERENIAFLSVGRPEEEGCYCQLNTLLREAIEILSRGFDITVVDAEAGIEQISRRVMRSVNTMFFVSDTSLKGMRVASAIAEAAREEENIEAFFLLNRVQEGEEIVPLMTSWGQALTAWIPEDVTVYSFDRAGRSFLDLPHCPAYEAVNNIITRLVLDGPRLSRQ